MVARETVAPVPVTGRRPQRRERYTRRTVHRAVWVGGVCVTLLLGYTIPFAGAAQEGYRQNQLKQELQSVSRDNEFLRAELARLKNPGMVAAHAQQIGMEMRQSARFMTLPAPQNASRPQKSLLARLSTFRFR